MEKKRTVLQVVGTMNRGGAETMLVNIIRELKDDFCFILLVNKKKGTTVIGDYDEELSKLGCKFYYIDTVWDIGIGTYTKEFINVVRRIGQVDLVHCHLNSRCGIVSRAAYKAGIHRIIAHSHAEIRFSGNRLRVIANYMELYFERILINRYATDYWGCSKKALFSLYTKKNINSGYSQVINNAIDVDKFTSVSENSIKEMKAKLGIPKDKKVVGTIGRIARVKNTAFTVDVIAELCRCRSDILFVLVGQKQEIDYSEEIFNKINISGLKENFLYIEPRSDLEFIYPMFDVFIGASFREGFPLVAIESQASSVPCIFSEGFPMEADIGLDLVKFIEGYEIEDWVVAIQDKLNQRVKINQEQRKTAVCKAGFDISTEAKKVKRLYLKEESSSACTQRM